MVLFSSDRLEFCKLTEEFFEDFCAMDLDPEVMNFYTSRPHGKREYAVQSFQRYQDYMKGHPDFGGFAALSKSGREFVGMGVLIHLELDPANSRYEVGYRLPQRSWGKGYATEICSTLIRYGFEDLKLPEIFGTTHPEHKVSQKVLLKCGLVKIGEVPNYGGSTLFRISRPACPEV